MRRSRSSLAIAVAAAACGAPRGPDDPGRASVRCPAGEVTLAGPDHVARLAGCPRAGRVTIRTGAALELGPLGALEAIDGDLAIGPSVGLSEATFGGLRTVGGTIRVVGNGDLRGLRLPRLEQAGRISIEGNSALQALSMPRLREVREALIVSGNPDLEIVDAGALEVVGAELAITDNGSLVLIEAARLERTGDVRVSNNKLLPEDTARALEARRPRP